MAERPEVVFSEQDFQILRDYGNGLRDEEVIANLMAAGVTNPKTAVFSMCRKLGVATPAAAVAQAAIHRGLLTRRDVPLVGPLLYQTTLGSNERLVLRLTLEGLKGREIAERMGVSLRTVNNIKRRANDALRTRRTELSARIAQDRGLL